MRRPRNEDFGLWAAVLERARSEPSVQKLKSNKLLGDSMFPKVRIMQQHLDGRALKLSFEKKFLVTSIKRRMLVFKRRSDRVNRDSECSGGNHTIDHTMGHTNFPPRDEEVLKATLLIPAEANKLIDSALNV